VEATAKALKVELHSIEVRGPSKFEGAFASWADAKIGGFVMGDHTLLTYNAGVIASLAAYMPISILLRADELIE
jgi:hypothetical protein